MDKTVVNWLMQVISGKDPLELGINDDAAGDAAPEPRPQIVASRDAAKEKAAAPQSQNVNAEDLGGAPMRSAMVESKPVYDVVEADEPIAGPYANVSSPAKEERAAEAEPEPESERSEPGRFKRMFGLKVVGGAKPTRKEAPAAPGSLVEGLLRDGVSYGPPATEASSSIANSLRSKSANLEPMAGGFDPLDLVRDPDYYEEKMRARESAGREVDFIPTKTEPVAPVFEREPEPVAPVFKREPEPELQQVVHEVESEPVAPVAAPAVDRLARVEQGTEPEALAATEPVAPVAAAISDPFAGVDFSAKTVEVEAVEPVAPAMPAIPDPFAGIDFSTAPPKVEAMEPPAPPVPAIPDPFAGVDFSIRPVAEAKAAEPVAVVAAPEVVEAKLLEAKPVEVEQVPAEPKVAEAVPEPVAAIPEPEVAPLQVETAREPEVIQAAPAVPAVPAILNPFGGIDFSAEPVAVVAGPELTPEPEAVFTMPEAEAPWAEVTQIVEFAPRFEEHEAVFVPEIVAEPEYAATPQIPAAIENAPEVVAEPVVEGPAEVEPKVVEEAIPAIPEFAAMAEETVAAESELPAVTPEPEPMVAAAANEPKKEDEDEAAANAIPWTVAVAQRNPNDITFSAQEYYQQQSAKEPPKKVAKAIPAKKAASVESKPVEGAPVKPGEANPDDLSAAIKTLMQLGSVLPLAGQMAPGQTSELGSEPTVGGGQEVQQEVSGLRLLQYEIKTTVQDHGMHLKRLEEQLSRIRESAEMDSVENASVMDNVKSTAKMVKVMGVGLGVMLLVLILMIGMILAHAK